MFNDGRRHHVWNFTDKSRVILMRDVVKPEYGVGTKWSCARILSNVALLYLQARVPALRRLPRRATAVLHQPSSLPFWMYLLFRAWPRTGTLRLG